MKLHYLLIAIVCLSNQSIKSNDEMIEYGEIAAISISTASACSAVHHVIAASIYPQYYFNIIKTSPKVAILEQSITNSISAGICLIMASKFINSESNNTSRLTIGSLSFLALVETVSLMGGIYEYYTNKPKHFNHLAYFRNHININKYNNLSNNAKRKLHAIDFINSCGLVLGIMLLPPIATSLLISYGLKKYYLS
jgi:hypothetical protein